MWSFKKTYLRSYLKWNVWSKLTKYLDKYPGKPVRWTYSPEMINKILESALNKNYHKMKTLVCIFWCFTFSSFFLKFWSSELTPFNHICNISKVQNMFTIPFHSNKLTKPAALNSKYCMLLFKQHYQENIVYLIRNVTIK